MTTLISLLLLGGLAMLLASAAAGLGAVLFFVGGHSYAAP